MLIAAALAAAIAREVPRPQPTHADDAMLGRATLYANPSDPGWAQLWQRLDAGLPISALAFGSSVTATQGGCSHSVVPWCDACCGARNYGHPATRGWGWLRQAFDWLNDTWPHRDNRLFNAGKASTPLGGFSECLRAWLPAPVDLWILELGVIPNRAQDAERLVRVLRSLPGSGGTGPPAVLLVALYDWCSDRARMHVRPCPTAAQQHADALPGVAGGFRVPLELVHAKRSGDDTAATLARYYGLRAISMHDAWWPALWRAGVRGDDAVRGPRLGELTTDGVHPTRVGIAMLADLLRDSLWQSYSSWRWCTRLGAHGGRAARSAALPPPITPNLSAHTSLACYGFDVNQLARARSAKGGDVYAVGRGGEGNLLAQLLPGRAGAAGTGAERDGWRIVERERASRTQLKPGLVAEQVGAVARLQLLPVSQHALTARRAQRPGPSAAALGGADPSGAGLSHPYVTLSYLQSYEHMGVARAACEGACSCASVELDGHSAAHRISYTVSTTLSNVSLDRARLRAGWPCVLRLEVLARSSSGGGGHRFKLMQVVVGDREHA